MKQNTKDWFQYLSAGTLILAAIALAFMAYICEHQIEGGTLAAIFQFLSGALGIFGIMKSVRNIKNGHGYDTAGKRSPDKLAACIVVCNTLLPQQEVTKM